jgi:hypothetical protein
MQDWKKTVVKIRKPSCLCLVIWAVGYMTAWLSLPTAMWAVDQVEKGLGISNPVFLGAIGGGILIGPPLIVLSAILHLTQRKK